MNLSGAIWSDASEAAEGESSWWDSVVKSFTDQWWVFVVALAVVVVVMIVIAVLTHGKLFGPVRILKIVLNCILGFVLLLVINIFGGLFTQGGWALTPKWFSWIIIGVFGILGVIFLFIASFAWPGVLTVQ